MGRSTELKAQLAKLADLIAAHEAEVQSFVAKVKRMPQGAERWELEEWIITKLHVDPELLGARAVSQRTWSKQDWLANAIELKAAARKYRDAGLQAKAEACEADAKVANARAAWMP